MITDKPNAIRGFIISRFGTYENLANALDVSIGAVSGWARMNPRGILKYAPEICFKYEIDPRELVDCVQRNLTEADD
jgi:hypothetical protein